MSGFCHRFIDIVEIDPLPITAADKQIFQATTKGKMLIVLPNGDNKPTHIYLTNALYAPSMGVTLVPISHIAKAGCTVMFSEDFC